MKIKSVKKINVSGEVFNQMKDMILSGEWKPGEKIPSENELTEMFKVSRVTIRESLKKLISYDILTAKQGSGTYVNKISDGALFNPMMMIYIRNMDERSIRDMMEFRGIFEKESVYLATLRCEDEDIIRLEALYQEMLNNRGNIKEFSRCDLEFHRYVSIMTRNSILIEAATLIWDFMSEHFLAVVEKIGVEKGSYYHGEIIKAIRAKDPDKARSVMSEHIQVTNHGYFNE